MGVFFITLFFRSDVFSYFHTMKKKIHTTTYHNNFIGVAPDTSALAGTIPPVSKSGKTIALMQYEKLNGHPYKYTSDELIFEIFAERNGITQKDWNLQRGGFFSNGQACMRTSPLAKTYGWGIHSNADGKIAIYPMEGKAYEHFATDPTLSQTIAMRNNKKQ